MDTLRINGRPRLPAREAPRTPVSADLAQIPASPFNWSLSLSFLTCKMGDFRATVTYRSSVCRA